MTKKKTESKADTPKKSESRVRPAAARKSAPKAGPAKASGARPPSKPAPPRSSKAAAPSAKRAAPAPKQQPPAKKVAAKPSALPKPATEKGRPAAAIAPAAKSAKPVKPVKSAKATAGRDAKGRPIPAARTVAPTSLADAKAAALKIAAAAGLRPVEKHTDNGDQAEPRAQRLTKSPLAKKELDRFREVLVQKRAQVAGDVRAMEHEALAESGSGALSSLPQHMADQGSDEYDQSLALGIAASQRKLLREIDEAIERISRGDFGVCQVLGTAINKDRLEATPWARYCLEGARMVDRGLLSQP